MSLKTAKFLKVKFLQSVELASVGYSHVGGPERNGVYLSVPVEAMDGWYPEALAKDGAMEILGEGESPDDAGDKIAPEHQKAFKASGLTQAEWLALLPVERDAQVGAFNDKEGREKRFAAEDAIRSATEVNSANAAARAGNPNPTAESDAAAKAALASKDALKTAKQATAKATTKVAKTPKEPAAKKAASKKA